MDFYQIDQFLILADSLHFKKASAEAHLSPSALTRSIQRLEEEVGTALFERDSRSVRLTRRGQQFREWAIEVTDSWKRFQFRMQQEDNLLAGELSLFGSVTAFYSLMSPIIEQFRQTYPEIHLKLQTGSPSEAVSRLESSEADLGITMLRENFPESIDFLPLTTTPLVFITRSDDKRSEKDLDWSREPMVIASSGLGRERVDQWFRQMDILPRIYAQTEGNETIIAMVSLGCGIGIVPELVIQKSPLQDKVRILDVDAGLEPYVVGLCVQKRRMQNPLVKAFWDFAGKNYLTGV